MAPKPLLFHCSDCGETFAKKTDLRRHEEHHRFTQSSWVCATCQWPFESMLALKRHQMISSHLPEEKVLYDCERCSNRPSFATEGELVAHQQFPSKCADAYHLNKRKQADHTIDHTNSAFSQGLDVPGPLQMAIDSQSNKTTDGVRRERESAGIHCGHCKKHFGDMRSYEEHLISCLSSQNGSKTQTGAYNAFSEGDSTSPLTNAVQSMEERFNLPEHGLQEKIPGFVEKHINKTNMQPKSTPLQKFERDATDISSQKQLKHDADTRSPNTQKRNSPPGLTHNRARKRESGFPNEGIAIEIAQNTVPRVIARDDLNDLQLADIMTKQTKRLNIQSDVHILHEGKIICSGIDWTRVPVNKYSEAITIIDALCHLPRALQAEHYLPKTKAFSSDQYASDSPANFRHSLDRSDRVSALDVVAISCSKVLMPNKCREVVKVAAVDVLSGRILLHHLVCPDFTTDPIDWHTGNTGLSGWNDMEDARQAGYRVLQGWPAVRSMLSKFVDKETILVGHNLRDDLDCLRLIHGRGIDIVKMVENAAGGPLSKQQLSLSSLSRDLLDVRLLAHPMFGRDCLQDAYAIRQLLLWKIKNDGKLERWAKAKSLEIQRLFSAND